MNRPRQHVLVTNDDGIGSGFLHVLVEALQETFAVTVAAPDAEQSWIGRAISRRRRVAVAPYEGLACPAWKISGTPTDCVNIALGNLLEAPPDAVVSGINIGYNTSTPLVYSSGTVAGAMEGAFWGLPAFAISQELDRERFQEASGNREALPQPLLALLQEHARHAHELVERLLHEGIGHPQSRHAVVHNLNYPMEPVHPFRTALTVPVTLRATPFYHPDGDGAYVFRYQKGAPLPSGELTDREAISRGWVSHSILNFSALGGDLNH